MAWLKSLPDDIAGWSLKKRFLFLFVLGALCVPAMPPHGWWLLLGPGLSLFYLTLCSARSARTAFFESWMFAFGYFGFGLVWIGNALLVEGNPFSWVWPLAIAGLPALLATFYGIAGCMLQILIKNLRSWAGWCAFVGAIAFTEWIRGHIFTGFPWNLYGYAWNNNLSMAQSVSLFGAYGLTFFTIAWAMIPALWWITLGTRKQRFMVSGVLAFCALGLFLWGYARLANHPIDLRSDVTLRIVQPNIPQEDKWDNSKAGINFRKLMDLSRPDEGNAGSPTIIIWPETAVIERLMRHPDAKITVRSMLQSYRQPAYLATGILRSDVSPDGKDRYYNSLVTYDRDLNRITQYDKSHLVPFGEYIPYREFIPLKPFVEFSGFESGNGPETQAIDQLIHIAPLVCYEVIFPGQVVSRNIERADIMINVTNDGWYGDSAGPRQHLAMARFRAIEEGIPVARSANTGISGLFDSYGRALATIPLNEAGTANVALPKVATDPLFTWIGDLLFFIFVIMSFLLSYTLKKFYFRNVAQ